MINDLCVRLNEESMNNLFAPLQCVCVCITHDKMVVVFVVLCD